MTFSPNQVEGLVEQRLFHPLDQPDAEAAIFAYIRSSANEPWQTCIERLASMADDATLRRLARKCRTPAEQWDRVPQRGSMAWLLHAAAEQGELGTEQ